MSLRDAIIRLRAENAELQNAIAGSIHTCGPTCRKTAGCAERSDLRAEIERLNQLLASRDAARATYLEERNSARTEVERLRRFAAEVMAYWPEGDVDGGDIQDIAVKYGILIPVTVIEPCGEGCNCAEYHGDDGFDGGVICYRRVLRGDGE